MSSLQGKKILVMAGGTGGHVFPALAVARALEDTGAEIAWMGTRRGIESRLMPQENIPLHCIDVEGVRGKGKLALLKAPWQVSKALSQARGIIRTVQPDLVLGFGGFASGPGGLAAKLCGLPLLIHEQNAVAGTTNRLLAKIADRVMAAFPCDLKGATVVGNPVRKDIARLPEPAARVGSGQQGRYLLVLGGSLGAQAINETLPQALAQLPAEQRPLVVHQAGPKLIESAQRAYEEAGVAARVIPFIDDMADAYAGADLVVCRAGALTVSEVAAAGVGAIMVPFPYAIDDHQTKNGEWLANAGAGEVIQQKDLTAELLAEKLAALFGQPQRLLQMAEAARDAAKTGATGDVVEACEELVR
ncbi:undecaprenyldiphospho-muramoylpentapeptide beta-N-acetylglucosaminyltransferase [Biformimicrobium ophioploci]|uniref:UDP-N-acetylglucosamine--N-acetylmuramyl-(pentapeptide) pyrophosphoryl-undecaprenol N-acetylglucosamine transferase n=1 Tax=Biformimicrobium ophioploci TaxID=3036711 RepID=A0ABQ6LX58_9GAMM|nr:undecaprenyldiphospho-muramoylpentapeptide beta-N-acetylglucosaminyltransferase [Microbulbifer sp. NKW57]GMG86648.1 undecaprenyldiphospho-muramoylpentapeptide beta-N-acetylglucosaminyltransferase [Microbulbifer sp. NKW57]